MKGFVTTGLAAALAVTGTAAIARDPVPLEPLMKWNLHYADNSCQLMRTFGDPARPVQLLLERTDPDSSLSLLVFGGPLKSRMDAGTATAWFAPHDKHRFEGGTIAETVPAKDTALLWSNIGFQAGSEPEPRPKKIERSVRDLAREGAMRALESQTAASITDLVIVEPGGRRTVLQTGPLDRAVAMMRECAREQMANWGVDPAIEDKIVRRPWSKFPFHHLFSSRDYPPRAWADGEQAIIKARLNVGADGKVTRCTSLTRFRTEEFGKVSCANLSRARFLPAELADGTKVPSYVITTIRFQM